MSRDHVNELFGCAVLDDIFREGAPKVSAPWPRAGRRRDQPRHFTLSVEDLRSPIWLTEVDPRELWASQGWVVRHHAAYYFTREWELTGLTSADRNVASNQWPVVRIDDQGRKVILAGHHRSLAALIEGRPVLARVFPGDPDGAEALIPTILFGASSRVAHVRCADVEEAVTRALAGDRALLSSRGAALDAVLGLSRVWSIAASRKPGADAPRPPTTFST